VKRSLEAALKEALGDASTKVETSPAVDRLTSITYGGQTRRRGRAAFGLAALVTITAVVVLFVVLSSGSPALRAPASMGQAVVPAAFVGWTPAPSKATAKRIAEYAKRCRWAASYRSQLKTPLITDIRGPYTALLFVDEHENYERFCLYGPDMGVQGSGRITYTGSFDPPPGPKGIQHNAMSGSCNPANGKSVMEMHGQVGHDVTGATFLFPNHARVVASVNGGFYMVWWPWSGQPKEVKLYTTVGSVYINLHTPHGHDWC
jgi:hypothetical protein